MSHDVIKPAEPTPSDLRLSGALQVMAGFIWVLAGYLFLTYVPEDGAVVAAAMFWLIALMLLVVGTTVIVFADRGGRPGRSRP